MIYGVDTSANVPIIVIEENSQADPTHSSSEATSVLFTTTDMTLLWSDQLSQDFTALLSFPNINSKGRPFDFMWGTVKTQQV